MGLVRPGPERLGNAGLGPERLATPCFLVVDFVARGVGSPLLILLGVIEHERQLIGVHVEGDLELRRIGIERIVKAGLTLPHQLPGAGLSRGR